MNLRIARLFLPCLFTAHAFAAPPVINKIERSFIEISTREITDAFVVGRGDVAFSMVFYSNSQHVGWFGRGWSSEISKKLYPMPDGTIVVYQHAQEFDVYGSPTPAQEAAGIDRLMDSLKATGRQLPIGLRSELEESADAWFWASVANLPRTFPSGLPPDFSQERSRPSAYSKPAPFTKKNCYGYMRVFEDGKADRKLCNGDSEDYDAQGNLIHKIFNSQGGRIDQNYVNGKLASRTTINFKTDETSRMDFVWKGPVISEVHQGDKVYKFEYNDDLQLIKETLPDGGVRRYEYGQDRQLLRIHGDGTLIPAYYDDQGELIGNDFVVDGKLLDTMRLTFATDLDPNHISVTVQEGGRSSDREDIYERRAVGPTLASTLADVDVQYKCGVQLDFPGVYFYYNDRGRSEDSWRQLRNVTRRFNECVKEYSESIARFRFENLRNFNSLDTGRQALVRQKVAHLIDIGRSQIDAIREDAKDEFRNMQAGMDMFQGIEEGRARAARENAAFWRDFAENSQRAAQAWANQMRAVELASRGTTPELEQAKAQRDAQRNSAFYAAVEEMERDPNSDYNREKRAHEQDRKQTAQKETEAGKRGQRDAANTPSAGARKLAAETSALADADARRADQEQQAKLAREKEAREQEEHRQADLKRLRDEQQAQTEAANRKRDEEAAKRKYLELMQRSIQLTARSCPDGKGLHYIVGSRPRVKPEAVSCIDVSYREVCRDGRSASTGTLRNFLGAATDCFMGDAASVSPTPSCKPADAMVLVTGVQQCSR